jgi:hypothetical protein
MRLDSAAQRALNVLRNKTDSSDTFSLYGLLNRAKTPMGKRLLKARGTQSNRTRWLGAGAALPSSVLQWRGMPPSRCFPSGVAACK